METSVHPSNFFILYKPKDIVSGDFYHALAFKPAGHPTELFFVCTADCTGHGVPGALMSMMGISYLNEAIVGKKIIHPNEILDDMRRGIIASLNPEGSEEEGKDGMDGVLCAYDFENMKMEFSMANNPLLLLRDNKITEYKPDKMPVGKYGDIMKPFSLHQVDLKKNDIVYTFSDGFADQFGGPQGKKFKQKHLMEVLLNNSVFPMHEQRNNLEKVFDEWKGEHEQIDDVLVIGIRI
ncbi:MAG TPA: SpoIIE family protein phosphatase [Bacteroidia bacterium]